MIRTFENFPGEAKCLICGTNKNEETMLISITDIDKINWGLDARARGPWVNEASPIHTGCLNLTIDKKNNIIFQVI